MPKLIDNFIELAAVESSKGYKIVLDEDGYSACIEPIVETEETEKNYYDHHIYLSTHTFYGNEYERSTKILRKFGFDVQLANWDE